MPEIWKSIPLPECAGKYEVSNMGNVRNALTGRALKQPVNRDGYAEVALYRDVGGRSQHTVHKLVALTFIGPRPDGHLIDHINGRRDDNRIINLRYLSPRDNAVRGERHGNAKLTASDIIKIRAAAKGGEAQRKIAARFGVTQTAVSDIVLNKVWKHVQEAAPPLVQMSLLDRKDE